MATEALMRKEFGALRPVDAAGKDLIDHIGKGELVKVKISRPRNAGHHRKFFALLNLVFENQEHYPTLDHMLVALKVALGHCDTVILKNGQTAFIPRSISFAKMDQTEFEAFWDKACQIITKHFLPGVTKAQLEREVLELMGAEAA